MSLHKRLEDLEARTRLQQVYEIPRHAERLFHTLTNARRELDGLEPLPDLEYTKEDYEDDLKTLDEHIPNMRAEPGWQKDEGKAFLDSWERDVKEQVERYKG